MIKALRSLFRWKFAFYGLFLPVLRGLGPVWGNRILLTMGRTCARLWPRRKSMLIDALRHAHDALDLDGPTDALWPELAASSCRFLARDYLLDTRTTAEALSRFDVHGYDRLVRARRGGQGVILVGSHAGAHIAGLHWLFRQDLHARAMVQRPSHVSRTLSRCFDEAQQPGSEDDLFLQRDLPLAAAVRLMMRARAALRMGRMVYLCGDIPWPGPNTRTGWLLGRQHRFLAFWTDLAVLVRAPVFHVFCDYLPDGRYRLEFEDIGLVQAGEEHEALADYLKHLEARIASSPEQAVAHLLWPCYRPTTPKYGREVDQELTRPSRRNAVSAG